MKPTRLTTALTTAAVAASTLVPQLAWASASYTTTIKSIANEASNFLSNIGYGLLTVIAGIAFVVLVAALIGAFGQRERNDVKQKIYVAVIVIVLCVLAGFLPAIINGISDWAQSAGGGNVDLGSVTNTLG